MMQLHKRSRPQGGLQHRAALTGAHNLPIARHISLRQQDWRFDTRRRPAVALTEVETRTLLQEGERATPSTAPAEAQPAAFNWFRHWWPVSRVDYLDTERPTKHTLLGRDYVVWQQQGEWRVFQDKCPHRLAPLSQGRIINNSLQCSYHGWTFDSEGKCTSIPQAPSEQQQSSCSNKRSCATSYPTMVEQGILYAWLDASPEGVELSRTKGVPLAVGDYTPWQYDMPNDALGWLEQQMDPAHAHFLHAGRDGFKSKEVVPMEVYQGPEVDLQKGFTIKHGGYSTMTQGMDATRYFFPPHTMAGVYHYANGTGLSYHNMIVPTSPGRCRLIAGISLLSPGSDRTLIKDSLQHRLAKEAAAATGTAAGSTQDAAKAKVATAAVPAGETAGGGKDAKTAQGAKPTVSAGPKPITNISLKQRLRAAYWKYIRSLPHWVYAGHTFADQDVVMIASQERVAIRNKLSPKNYHLPAINIDVGIPAINKWLVKAGYPEVLFADAKHPGETEPLGTLPLDQILDRKSRHVNCCIICRKGERLVTKACIAVTVAAAVCGVFALALAAMGLVKAGSITAGRIPLLVSSLLTPVLAWLSVKWWDFREERFVSGLKAWNRVGGLSFVPRA